MLIFGLFLLLLLPLWLGRPGLLLLHWRRLRGPGLLHWGLGRPGLLPLWLRGPGLLHRRLDRPGLLHWRRLRGPGLLLRLRWLPLRRLTRSG